MNNFIEPRNWWKRDYAIEWWRTNGHFNEDLYLSVLVEKQQGNNKSNTNKKENHKKNEQGRKQFIFFRFLLIRKWLGIERENMVEAQ
jgi:hypothetical protein